MPPGPFQVGVTTRQFDDHRRRDPDSGGPRRLQTEIWYPAAAEAAALPPNRFSEFLGRGAIPGSIEAANAGDAIGGYLPGLTIEQLDREWPNAAVRDARPLEAGAERWPLVVFSHGSGAFRASYIYFTEFLASHGFVVMACDHLGSMEADRPEDMIFLIDEMARMAAGGDSRFAGRVDVSRCALTGMSFGGFASAAALERQDPRVKAAIMKCPSLASGGGRLPEERANRATPVFVMLGAEDTVIGERGNELCRQYFATHSGPACLLEIKAGGHVSFTSCELYNPSYGNGIGESKSLSQPGATYTPLPIAQQHAIVNSYALAFLNAYLRPSSEQAAASRAYLQTNQFGDEIVLTSRL
ncbi:unnamed protein product [Prorocentrum cordatum]|uniref:1-alkyl-2-acetylglycerophosphocholine esterase n=1 Tax=Prorocentrum cordatum TaxID=2364126 RepID=A0ABN9T4F3_9DINO|nr:unnamed protein product [Polarella glacialis]